MDLKEKIYNIKIIDDHVHAFNDIYWKDAVGDLPFSFAFDKLDIPTKTTPLTRAETLCRAYQELYDFPHPTITPDNESQLNDLYLRSKSNEAPIYHRALDRAGIEYAFEVCLSNPQLPPGLDPERFKRMPYLDGLTIPLDNSALKSASRQAKAFLSMAEAFAANLNQQLDLYPTSFQEYLMFVSTAIEKLRDEGCVAIKLNHAYWRTINISEVTHDQAREAFDSKDTSRVSYSQLQDFLIRRIIAKAGELDLPVQIHTGGIGPERSMKEGDPTCLDGFLWLPDLRQAKVVLLHGGYPYCREAGFMVSRMWKQRKTCLDISWMWWGHFNSPNALVGILREWLEMGIVRRLIYGSDAGNPHQIWLSAMNIREALFLALKGMMSDGLINKEQALYMAELVLRGNAMTLYKL
jgi:predicted TIM-barrel fold metal-dependent hydrolase